MHCVPGWALAYMNPMHTRPVSWVCWLDVSGSLPTQSRLTALSPPAPRGCRSIEVDLSLFHFFSSLRGPIPYCTIYRISLHWCFPRAPYILQCWGMDRKDPDLLGVLVVSGRPFRPVSVRSMKIETPLLPVVKTRNAPFTMSFHYKPEVHICSSISINQ
jgi:hypothetical protein